MKSEITYPSVTAVHPIPESYALEISFSTGESGILNLEPFLDFGVFKTLKNFEVFKSVRIAFDTLEWSNGIDLDPEFVYDHCTLCTTAK